MTGFKLGEPRLNRANHYGEVTVSVEGKHLKVVEGFLVKLRKKEYVVTAISCINGVLRIRISDFKVLATSMNHSIFF